MGADMGMGPSRLAIWSAAITLAVAGLYRRKGAEWVNRMLSLAAPWS